MPFAQHLASMLGDDARKKSPLHLRLGVACLAVGCPEKVLSLVLRKPEPTFDLLSLLRPRINQDKPTARALARLTLPRFPVPRGVLEQMLDRMTDTANALVTCLTREQDDQLKAYPILENLVDRPRNVPEPEANRVLMDHYRRCDGVSSPEQALRTGRIIPWLERHHHAAHIGPDALMFLHEGELLSRMGRYELAWSLSAEFGEYELAARLYKELATENPRDAYSHLHRWVARAALDAGDLELAEDVFDSLTTRDIELHAPLDALRREFEHLSEIDSLGDQIYPADIPVAQRWKAKIFLPDDLLVGGEGRKKRQRRARLEAWYPGRVLSVDGGVATVLLADPRSSPRELFTATIKEADAAEMAGGEPATAGRFLEYGKYEGGIGRIRYYPCAASVRTR